MVESSDDSSVVVDERGGGRREGSERSLSGVYASVERAVREVL